MTPWLAPPVPLSVDPSSRFDESADRHLRFMDIALASVALLVLAIPMGVGLLVGRLRATEYAGCRQSIFRRWQIELSDSLMGRLLAKTGMTAWPVLFNILRGDMAWVGPKPVAAGGGDGYHPALSRVRPGLVNIWALRQRTAVDFGSELNSDLEYLIQRGLKHDLGLLLRALLVVWLPLPREADERRIGVGDVSFDNVSMTQAVERVCALLDGNTTQQVSFVNAACVNIAAHDRGYRRILARAALVLPDGIGIKIAADLMGVPLKQNVNGTDLFPRLCEALESRGASLFLLGGHPGIADRVAAVIREKWPRLRIAGVRDGYFSVAQEGDVAAEVCASKADVLFVARGVPMQDVFIDRHLHQLGVKAAIGVGGLFDFVSGRIDRAPSWMRDTGLEWIYRLMQEPSRMWQRYLVGNFSFLGRIVLQRLGLRKIANDELPERDDLIVAGAEGSTGLRTVIFATATAPHDVPVPEDYPLALLPFGYSTFAERTLEQLSNAGIRLIDLVVSGRPEELRRLLGSGERWGVQLRWHLAKDPSTPYGILQSLGLNQAQRVLIGHADRWIAEDALGSLVKYNQLLAQTDEEGVKWAGWGCVTPAMLGSIPPHCDEAALGGFMFSLAPRLLMLEPGQFIGVGNAMQLLSAQRMALKDHFMKDVPATWLRTAWGAHSPDALVEAGAMIEGPVLIGHGCFVTAGARIGPDTILTQDVVVSAGSIVRNSIVLPHSFVGHGLELDETIVNARSVQHLRLGVRTVMPSSEGLLLDLQPKGSAGSSWFARAMAVLACLTFLPWLAVDTGIRRVRGLPLRWRKRSVAMGRDTDSGEVRMRILRCARSTEHGMGRLLANYGAWMDVAAGYRTWFGARPRSLSEWYALGRDWQLVLANTPVGCIHAPAWSEGWDESLEARAAADVFFAVHRGMVERTRLLVTSLARLIAGDTKPA